MFWAPDLDDFSGNFCKNGAYPLMNVAVNIIRSAKVVSVPTITVKPPVQCEWTMISSMK